MTQKKKRILLKSALTILCLILVAIPFMDWNLKNKIQSEFNDIKFSIYNSLLANQDSTNVLLCTQCAIVSDFVKKYPIKIDIEMGCDKYTYQVSNLYNKKFNADFVERVQLIDKEYRRMHRTAHLRMFIILICSIIGYNLIDKLIENKFKEIETE